MQTSNTTASLRGIFSVDGKTAWASGTEGTVLRTIDGGKTWAHCAVPPGAESLDFRGIQAADADTAIVMSSGPGDKSRLYSTSDGGKSWKLILKNPDAARPEGQNGFFDSFFADWSQVAGKPTWTGSVMGDPVPASLTGPGTAFVLLDTADSGVTWTRRAGPSLNAESLGGFAASNSLFPVDQDGNHDPHLFASGGKSGAVVWIEDPLSHTWKRIELPLAHGADSTGIFSIAGKTESEPFRGKITQRTTLIAVGGDYAKPAESAGTAAWSIDRGLHWTAATKPPHGYRSSVAWSAELSLWIAAGTSGSDLSADDGKTWTPIDNGKWNALSLPFVVGPAGRIARIGILTPAP
jgi:hypothetical protein